MAKSIFITLALLFSLFSFASTAMADCKAQVQGQGSSSFGQGSAEVAARAAWQVNAGSQYGAPYSQWIKAQNKQPADCTKQGKFPKTHVCIYKANPCN